MDENDALDEWSLGRQPEAMTSSSFDANGRSAPRRARSLAPVCLLASFWACGCSTAASQVGQDAGPSVSDAVSSAQDAATTGPDAALAPSDATLPGLDAPAPSTGCFAGAVTLATSVAPAGGRAHVAPRAIVARDDGWLVFYGTLADGEQVAFLDLDGRVRASGPFSGFVSGRVVELGTSLLFAGDYDQQRIDLGDDVVTRTYPPARIPGITAVSVVSADTVRALSAPTVDGEARLRVTDLVLDAAQVTGLAVREGTLPAMPEVGYPSLFHHAIDGDMARLLGTGSFSGGPWRAILLQLGTGGLGAGEPVGYRVWEDRVWELTPAPETILGTTRDGRRALVPRIEGEPAGYASYLEPLPSDGAPVSALRLDGRARALLESEGRVSVLLDDRLVSFASYDLAPLAEMAFEGGESIAAQRGDRAAVVFAVGAGGPEARLELRCVTIPSP